MEKEKKVRSIRWTLLALTLLPMLIIAVVITIIAKNAVTQGMQEQALDGLKYTCVSADAGFKAVEYGSQWEL